MSPSYGISRAAQDGYALQSQQRTAIAHQEGRVSTEIAPITTTMLVTDKATGITTPLCQTSCRAPMIANDLRWSAIYDKKSTFS